MQCSTSCKSLIDLSKLRHRVTLQAKMRTPDAIGGATLAWTKVSDLWAAIEPLSAMQVFRMGQIETPMTHKVTIRYRPGVTTKQRLLFNGDRVLDIVEVLNLEERNIALVLRCREGELDV